MVGVLRQAVATGMYGCQARDGVHHGSRVINLCLTSGANSGMS
jgi:hypothetical protein